MPGQADSRRTTPIPRLARAATALVGLIYIFHVQHYWFVGDDASISFRYSANLASGHGLVWNSGEYVEGYSGSEVQGVLEVR